MHSLLKIISIFCSAIVIGCEDNSLPSFFTPCSRSATPQDLSSCLFAQAKIGQPILAKGLPEWNLEPLDPLVLSDLSAKAGTFSIKSKNVIVKGLKKIEIKSVKWDLEKKTGQIRIFGNLTFLSDYETEGRILLIPITGNGKLTVKMYDTDMLIKFKLKTIKDDKGVDHLFTYDVSPVQKYGHVKLHLSNLLGNDQIGDTINQVLNENWRDIMAEVGPPFVKGVAVKVHEILNKMYLQVPYDKTFAP